MCVFLIDTYDLYSNVCVCVLIVSCITVIRLLVACIVHLYVIHLLLFWVNNKLTQV